MKIQRNALMIFVWQQDQRSQKLKATKASATAREMMYQLSLRKRRFFLNRIRNITKEFPDNAVMVKVHAIISNSADMMLTWGLSLSWWREVRNLLQRKFESTKRPISLISCHEIQIFLLRCMVMQIEIERHSWYIILLSVAGSLIWFLLTEADFDQVNKKCDQMGKSPSS